MRSTLHVATLLAGAIFVCTSQAQAQPEGRLCTAEPTDETLAFGDLVSCALEPAGDSDLFRFQGIAGEVVSIRVTDQAGVGSLPGCRLQLFRPGDATPIGFAVGNTICEIRTTLDRSGSFTIRVEENNTSGVMTYAVELDRLRPFSPAAQILNPGSLFTDQRIDPRGDADLFIFAGTAGDVISLRGVDLAGTGSPPQIVLELFKPDGTFATSAGSGVFPTAVLDTTLNQTGVFTVRVREGTNDTLMSYTLEYQCIQGSCDPFHRVTSAFGVGPKAGDGGWFSANKDLSRNLGVSMLGKLPWPAYNASGRGVRLAAGDVDGDGLDEIVAGLDTGGGGWIAVLDDGAHNYALLKWIQVQWSAYNAANGEVWPAVGNLDGDARAEIVAGLGAGGKGWFEVFDDAAADFTHLAFRQVAWPAYASTAPAVVRPAIGNVDGAGAGEIILGLGPGSNGWIEVVHGAAGNYAHRAWLQVNWSAYNGGNGATFPAAGDVDGDGRAEIVAGLGMGGGGWLEVFEDANAGYAHAAWLRVAWAAYNQTRGETHPALGDLDADGTLELIVGLAAMPGQGGWFETFDPDGGEYPSLGWRNLGWSGLLTAGSAMYPAIGLFR
jgi:hypothetical protein